MKNIYWNAILAICLFIQCTTSDSQFKDLFGQENSVWAESIYLRGYQPTTFEKLTDDHLKKYAETLKNNGVKYTYLFAGPYDETGHLPSYSFSNTAINSVRKLKEYYPEIVILPWVGGVQNKTVYLGDSTWVENALLDTKKLINILNVPGVHVDFEYILSGDFYLDQTIRKEKPGDRENHGNNVNTFHRKLRALLPKAFISSVVVATSPDTKPWKRKTTMDELKVLTNYVDQLSFLYYDTHIDNQEIFETNCYSLLKDIQTLKLERNIQYLVAIGTFVNVPELRKYRNLDIENIPNSLSTIKKEAIRVDSTMQIIDGIAIYSDWATDKKEWKQFQRHWAKL